MYQAGLVLEGGGMKGVYTAGVLDFFLEKGIEFTSCYGVSAGAHQMCSYLSKQKGRGYRAYVDYLDNKHYCGVGSLLTSGDLFNVKICYDLIPHYLNPFDEKTFEKYAGKAYVVVTNIKTGRAEYIRIKNTDENMDAIRASSSLPLVSRSVQIGKNLYLDGALTDSIPIQKSILDGNRKNIVVMTKETGYRRKPISTSMQLLLKARYFKYPKVYELMKGRHIEYNATLDFLKNQEKNGQAFVIRPEYNSGVKRVEKDKEKLEALYHMGYEDGKKNYDKMIEYLEK